MRTRASPLLVAIVFLLLPMTVHAEEVPANIHKYAVELGDEYGICPEFIEAVIYYESGYQPKATNGGCKGLMQISEKSHKARMKRLGVTDLYDSYGNMLVGVDFLAELFETYEDTGRVLLVYNGVSAKRIRQYEETGEMTAYCRLILNKSASLERQRGK